MTPSDYLSVALLIAGGVFFLAGTLGLLRFPDVYTPDGAKNRTSRMILLSNNITDNLFAQ